MESLAGKRTGKGGENKAKKIQQKKGRKIGQNTKIVWESCCSGELQVSGQIELNRVRLKTLLETVRNSEVILR